MKEEEEGGEGAVAVTVDRRLNPLRELQVILSDNRGRGVVLPLRVGAVHRGEGRGGGKSTVACGGKRRRKRRRGGSVSVCMHFAVED